MLDKREDSYKTLLRAECEYLGVPYEFFRVGQGLLCPPETYGHINVEPPARSGYPAWTNRPNSYNAFLSFRKIIEKAQADQLPSLLILEDDAYFVESPEERPRDVFVRAYDDMVKEDPQWEFLYLGANHTFSRTTSISRNLLRLSGSGCWHAVLLSERAYQLVLDLPLEGPIDGEVAKKLHPRNHSYACWPSIVWTRAGYSHCEGREVDYHSFFQNKGCP